MKIFFLQGMYMYYGVMWLNMDSYPATVCQNPKITCMSSLIPNTMYGSYCDTVFVHSWTNFRKQGIAPTVYIIV